MPISQNSGVYRVGAQYGVLRQQQNLRDPDLVLWLKRGTDMFTDVSATIHAVTNDPVAAWKDNATNIIASQATPTARPTRQAGGELSFDGADSLVNNSSASAITRNRDQISIYVRAAPSAFTARRLALTVIDGGSGGARVAMGVDPDAWIVGGRRLNTDTFQFISTPATESSAVLTGIFLWRSSTLRLFVNGEQRAESTAFQSVGATSDTDAELRVGHSGAQIWIGSIAEIRLYHAAHDAATIASISASMAL